MLPEKTWFRANGAGAELRTMPLTDAMPLLVTLVDVVSMKGTKAKDEPKTKHERRARRH
jgi:hypothetical protein